MVATGDIAFIGSFVGVDTIMLNEVRGLRSFFFPTIRVYFWGNWREEEGLDKVEEGRVSILLNAV